MSVRIEYRIDHSRSTRLVRGVRTAFRQFLAVPSLVMLGFLLLSVLTNLIDRTGAGWVQPLRRFMINWVFHDSQTSSSLLGSIAGSLITVTSITFSVLLIAVQQSAAAMTHQVIDQFLRRWVNQFIFGFFVGLALFAIITHATVGSSFNPIVGASLVLVLTLAALYLLLVLIYSTIDQMHPSVVVQGVRGLTLKARRQQLDLVRKTRPCLQAAPRASAEVVTVESGYLTNVDIDPILSAIAATPVQVTVEFAVSVGAFLNQGGTVARLWTDDEASARQVGQAITSSISIERRENLHKDASYGIEQLRTIAWTTVSTSKQNPAVALSALHALREILIDWMSPDYRVERDPTSPVSYEDDTVERIFTTFEQLAVVSTRSVQEMTYAEVLRACVETFDRLPPECRDRWLDVIQRIAPLLQSFTVTADLEAAVEVLLRTLRDAGEWDSAQTLSQAMEAARSSR